MQAFRFLLHSVIKPWWWGMLALALSLQLYFLLRIVAMIWIDPGSSAFERSEWLRLARSPMAFQWQQQWVPIEQIAIPLQRAIIASEDDLFMQHHGVHWDAMEKAWQKNERSLLMSQKHGHAVHLVGGSTISQQLVKNLFLSGERHYARKAQELVLTCMLETLLSKRRILEIYLNHVEWGQGVFGAQAAARHHFGKNASQLNDWEAARLAVMLPRPKWFERHPESPYWADRSEVILSRMAGAKTP